MKRILEITEEADKLLVTVCDHALKNGGFSVYSVISQLIAAIKTVDDKELP